MHYLTVKHFNNLFCLNMSDKHLIKNKGNIKNDTTSNLKIIRMKPKEKTIKNCPKQIKITDIFAER